MAAFCHRPPDSCELTQCLHGCHVLPQNKTMRLIFLWHSSVRQTCTNVLIQWQQLLGKRWKKKEDPHCPFELFCLKIRWLFVFWKHGAAMDENPRIADGQEAVFRYGEHQSGAKSSNFGNPRLLCILVCPVILIMVLLAVSVNSIWVSSLDRGLHKAEVADQSLLHAYNESSTATWLILDFGIFGGPFRACVF